MDCGSIARHLGDRTLLHPANGHIPRVGRVVRPTDSSDVLTCVRLCSSPEVAIANYVRTVLHTP